MGSRGGFDSGLPLRARFKPRVPILASHLVLTGYAHWLPNDLRGSGSTSIRKEDLKDLGDILPGRQFPQPPRQDVKRFHRDAKTLLEHEVIWFTEEMRTVIANAIAEAARRHGYTIWARASCSNHGHGVVRTHRDRSEVIWDRFANAAKLALRERGLVPPNHPVWAARPYKVFLHTPGEVVGRIGYVNDNPEKEGLARQDWSFVVPCPY